MVQCTVDKRRWKRAEIPRRSLPTLYAEINGFCYDNTTAKQLSTLEMFSGIEGGINRHVHSRQRVRRLTPESAGERVPFDIALD